MSVMGRQARRLFDLDIDEVSAVDRPANQHGLISISKSLGTDNTPEEGSMGTIYDAEGIEVFEDELEHGDVVFDEDGQELVYVEDGGEPLEGFDDGDDEVGKAGVPGVLRGGARGANARFYARQDLEGRARQVRGGYKAGRGNRKVIGADNTGGGQLAAVRAANFTGRHRNAVLAGGAAAGATAAGAGYEATKKSLGDSILADFSKAVTESDRQAVVVRLAQELDAQRAVNQRIVKSLDAIEDRHVTEAYVVKAAEYGLPVESTELGEILKSISGVLTDRQLELVDGIFAVAGEAITKEYGYAGGALNGGAYADLEAMASELVGKAAGGISMEQAQVALLEHDPSLYDAYLDEKMGR